MLGMLLVTLNRYDGKERLWIYEGKKEGRTSYSRRGFAVSSFFYRLRAETLRFLREAVRKRNNSFRQFYLFGLYECNWK